MLPLRLVIDTNVVVSGALKPGGLERTVLTLALTSPALLFVSPEILAEYGNVLSRPKLRIPPDERRALLKFIASHSRRVAPTCSIQACPDPGDNIFLECAAAARADFLVTGNKRHFPAYWRNTKVVNARELMGAIAPHLHP